MLFVVARCVSLVACCLLFELDGVCCWLLVVVCLLIGVN